jgi:hypothetical protein
MRRRLLFTHKEIKINIIESNNSLAGDCVLYDKEEDKYSYCSF